jgi:hypothetical protein
VAYIRGRVAVINPIHWKDFHSRLERFAQISRALLNELNDATPAFNLAWSKIGESSEGMTGTRLDRDELYPALSKLHGAALHALDGANRRREEGREGEHDAPWLALVSTLAELFEASGGKATAPKSRRDGSYANPSAFVELVWAIMMQIIPSEVCEFTHSKGAMADAISGALTKWRNRTF